MNSMQDIYKPLRSSCYSVSCELCSIGALCIPLMQDNSLETVLNKKRKVNKDEIIVKSGDLFNNLYVIHSGCIKTYSLSKDGDQQITGFYLPGDILGFDAVHAKKHNNYAQALSNSQICELKYNDLMNLVSRSEKTRNLVIDLMSMNILDQQTHTLMLSQKNAEERLACFVYSLYYRYSQRGHTSLNIKLSMSRTEIANYLGLTIETISRVFTRLQQLDILTVKGKHILIKNLNALIQTSGELI